VGGDVIEFDGGYLTIARISGDPHELAEGYLSGLPVMNGVGRDHGLRVHIGATTPDGLVLVNLWPSAAGSESAALDPRRGAQIAATGLRPEDISREHHEVAQAVIFDA
jgi:hypothetical protein